MLSGYGLVSLLPILSRQWLLARSLSPYNLGSWLTMSSEGGPLGPPKRKCFQPPTLSKNTLRVKECIFRSLGVSILPFMKSFEIMIVPLQIGRWSISKRNI